MAIDFDELDAETGASSGRLGIDFDALGDEHDNSKADFSNVTSGSSAPDPTVGRYGEPAVGPEATLSSEDWQRVKDWAPTALQIGAGIATGGLSIPAQIGANVAIGAGGRYLEGEAPFDPVSLGIDAAILPATNIAFGAAKGLLSPGMKQIYPNIREAIEDITKWAPLPEVKLTEAAARPLATEGGSILSALHGPVSVGSKARNADLRTLADRIDLFPRARDRILSFLEKADRDIFTERASGIRGALGRRTEVPLADREAMKLYLEGHRTAEEVGAGVVERAQKLRDVYDQMGQLGEDLGLLDENAPRIKGYSGPNVEKFPGEAVHSLADETGVARGRSKAMGYKPRTMAFDSSYHIIDSREGLRRYMKSAPEKFAGAYVFGPRGGTTSEGTQAFGRVANELLNRAASTNLGGDKLAFDLMRDSLKQIYQMRPPPEALERFAGKVGQLGSTIMLPRSWARQFRQQGMNVGRYGLGNTAEGIVRYLKDPEFRALVEASGAKTGSMSRLFNALRPDEAPNLVGRSIGWSEGKLRGLLSAGAVPYREQLIERIAGGGKSAALARQFREMGEDVGKVGLGRDAEALRDAYSRIVGRTQLLSGEAGQTSADLIGNQWGRTLGQFRPFGLGAYRLFRDDVLSPIAQGLKGDRSELALGIGRLSKALGTGLAAEEVSRAMLFPQTGQFDPDPVSAFSEGTRSAVGLPYDIGSEFVEGVGQTGTLGGGAKRAITSLSPPMGDIFNEPELGKLAILGLAMRHPLLGSAAAFTYPLYKDLLPEF